MLMILKILYWLSKTWKFLLGKPHSTIHGKAKFMDGLEKAIFLNRKNKGIYLSRRYRLSMDDSFKNLCLVSPTGGGKTTRYVIPNILNSNGSVVVTDPSGEIYEKTCGAMRQRGYKIQVLQPANLSRSLYFNPLAYANTHQELKQLATVLGSLNSTDNALFWQTSAINLIYICLAAFKNIKTAHLGNVRRLLSHMGTNDKKLKKFMVDHLDDRTFDEFKAFMAQEHKVLSSILATARVALDLWSDPDIVRFSSFNTIDISMLRKEKTIVYVIVPEHQLRYFAIIVNLFYTACFKYCIDHKSGNEVFFFLDEFGNLPAIPDFATIATTLRKKRCSISVILQELSQLDAVYGRDEARSIYAGGMGSKLFFAGLDYSTCQYLENMLGGETQYDVIGADGRVRHDEKARTHRVPIMRADEIRMLKKNEAILISGARKPMKINMEPYFTNRRLNRLTEIKCS